MYVKNKSQNIESKTYSIKTPTNKYMSNLNY